MIKVLINNVEQQAEQGFTVTQAADGITLATATVVVYSNSGAAIKPFTKVRIAFIQLGVNYLDFCVGADNVTPADKQGLWKHTLVLVEQTKILEKFVLQAAILTNTLDTMQQQVNKLLQNVEMAVFGETKAVEFSVATATAEVLAKYEAEEVKMSGTLREVLDAIFSAFDSRAKATITEWGDTLKIEIGHFSLTEYSDIETIEPITIARSNNVDDFCGSIYSDVKNAVGAKEITETNTLKARAATATTNDAEFLFAFPVEYITKAAFTLSKNVAFGKYITGTWVPALVIENMSDFQIDFTEWFVDSEYYQTLTDTEKNNYMAYTRGQTEQSVVSTYKFFLFTVANYENVLKQALKAWAKVKYPTTDIDSLDVRYSNTTALWSESYSDLYGILWTITYVPTIDTTVELLKPEATAAEKRLQIISNQQTATPDLYRYGNNLSGKLLRTGNTELVYDDTVPNFAGLWPLLGRINGFIVWKREFSAFDDYIDVRYYLTENYNNINQKIGINREIRLFTIPQTGLETILTMRATVRIGTALEWEAKKKASPIISHYALTSLIKGLFGEDVSAAKVGYSSIDTYGTDLAKTFLLPTANYGVGQTSVFQSKFYDNYTAGFSVTENKKIFDWIGGKKVAYCPYVDDFGEFTRISIQLGTAIDFSQMDTDRKIEVIKKLPAASSGTNFVKNITTKRALYYNKDREQAITTKYCLDFESTNNLHIIGTGFAANNALVGTEPARLTAWISKTKYSRMDITRVKGTNYFNAAELAVSDIFEYEMDETAKKVVLKVKVNDLTNSIIAAGYTAFAIGDGEENLYVAINNRSENMYLWG